MSNHINVSFKAVNCTDLLNKKAQNKRYIMTLNPYGTNCASINLNMNATQASFYVKRSHIMGKQSEVFQRVHILKYKPQKVGSLQNKYF